MNYMTTSEAATEIGVHDSRIRHMIRDGKLRATKFGRDWMILYDDLDLVRDRKPGRPKKENENDTGSKSDL